MKKFILLLSMTFFLALASVEAQVIQVYDVEDLGDSTIVNLSSKQFKNIHLVDSFYVEALYTGLTSDDTTAQVEIYSTLNNDFTDAVDLVPSGELTAADGDGGTGTIMKTTTITGSNFWHLRFVIDPDEDDSGAGKLTLRILPYYRER